MNSREYRTVGVGCQGKGRAKKTPPRGVRGGVRNRKVSACGGDYRKATVTGASTRIVTLLPGGTSTS